MDGVYHAEVDAEGYYKECDQYHWILNRWIRGVLVVPVIHCTYLVRADIVNDLTYEDGSERHGYVVFSHRARKSGIVQYLDNRCVYGYITIDEGHNRYRGKGVERAYALLSADLRARVGAESHDGARATIGVGGAVARDNHANPQSGFAAFRQATTPPQSGHRPELLNSVQF